MALTGDEPTPAKLVGAENVHVLSGAVEGDLKVVNAEYVFTNTPTGGNAEINEFETEITGNIEDGYVQPDGVTGDAVIVDADDVFIEHDAVGGELQVIGEEQLFHDESSESPDGRVEMDDAVTGWKRSLSLSSPQRGAAVAGGRCDVTLTDVTQDIELYVTGWKNSARIDGNATVTLHLIGSHNTVDTGPYIDLDIATESGIENAFNSDGVPHDDVIETTKENAYNGHLFGRDQVTFQVPATDEDHCPGCGADSNAIIKRRQEDAFFLFNSPVYHFDKGGATYECEECSMNVGPDVELTESERKDLLQ